MTDQQTRDQLDLICDQLYLHGKETPEQGFDLPEGQLKPKNLFKCPKCGYGKGMR